ADLVRRQVAAIVGAGTDAAQASKAVTATTPIIFVIGADPVRVGLVASLNRPGGNITGVVFTVVPLVAKLLGMLHELVPKASMIAVLRDPNGPDVESESRDLEQAARAIGHKNPDGERGQRARSPCRLRKGRASGRTARRLRPVHVQSARANCGS